MDMHTRLFSPIKIGGKLELPNRIVMPAMHLNYTRAGKVSDQLMDFYVARAMGGEAIEDSDNKRTTSRARAAA